MARRNPNWDTKEHAIEYMRKLSVDGVAPSVDYNRSFYSAVVNMFGNWSVCCDLAGVERRYQGVKGASKEEIVSTLKELAVDGVLHSIPEANRWKRSIKKLGYSWTEFLNMECDLITKSQFDEDVTLELAKKCISFDCVKKEKPLLVIANKDCVECCWRVGECCPFVGCPKLEGW